MAKRASLLSALLLTVVCAGAGADTSMLGTYGGLTVPYARVLPEGRLQTTVSAAWVDRPDGKTMDNEWYTANFGIFGTGEVGLSYVGYHTRKATDMVLHGKWLAVPETKKLPAVAVGVTDLTGEVVKDATGYIVASKCIWSPIDQFTGEPLHPFWVHAGLGTGIYGDSPFVGAEWAVTNRARLLVEWSKNLALGRNDYLFSVGAAYTVNDRFSVNAGALNMRYPAVSVSAHLEDLLGF